MIERIEDEAFSRVVRDELRTGVGFVPQDFLTVNSEGGTDSRYVPISNDAGGYELLTDRAYFEAMAYRRSIDGGIHTAPTSHTMAARVTENSGHTNAHWRAFLDEGTNHAAGANRGGAVPYELALDASTRGAENIVFAQSLDIAQSTVQFALWDNGTERPIDDQVDMINRILDHDTAFEEDREMANATFSLYTLARRAVYYKRARLVTAQGDQRVTIEGLPGKVLNRRDEMLQRPIEGVSTMLELPYMFDRRTHPDAYRVFHSRNRR